MDKRSPPGQRIQVIDRAAAILDALSRYSDSVSLKVLAAETGLHTSTTHRILSSLCENGFVERNRTGHYHLGTRLLRLASHLCSNVDIRAIALPVMQKLRNQLNESVHLTIREGDEVIYVEKATPNRMMHVQQLIGSRAPLHVTAVGKMLLGAGGAEACRGYAERTNLPALTRNTITDLDTLIQHCAAAGQQGYALDNEEAELDVGCIGVLIRDASGAPVAGLSVSAPIDRRQHAWIADIQAAAQNISERLGYQHS